MKKYKYVIGGLIVVIIVLIIVFIVKWILKNWIIKIYHVSVAANTPIKINNIRPIKINKIF